MNKTNLLLVIIILSAAFFCAATGVASAISLSDKYVGNTVVDLEWSKHWSEDFSCYKLYRNDSQIATISDRNTTFYRDTGPSRGVMYYYNIEVYNATGIPRETDTIEIRTGRIHGTITRDTTWSAATYNLLGVAVGENVTLTISPGVTVKSDSIFRSGIFVRVNGTLSSESATFDTVSIGETLIGGRYLVSDCLLYNGSYLYFKGSDSSVIGNSLTDGYISAEGNNNTIKGNTLTDGDITANGNNNTIKYNILNNSGDIRVWYGNNNTIKYNILNNSIISLDGCNYNIVAGNTLSGGGIRLIYAYNNTISENNVSNASSNGIHIQGASYNTVAGNIISNSGYCGIHIQISDTGSDNNIIKDNIISNSSYYGIKVDGNYNTIYNNYFDNEDNDCDQGWSNIWNITKTPGTNIVGGPYLGGNYWSDYTGTDADGDGFGDTPYEIDGTFAKDYLPLVKFSSPVWNVDTGEWFEKIQEAIGDPDTQDGHTIRVYEGTYTENVKVNKSLTIRSRGGREVTIVQAKDSDDHVFEVMKDSTTIQGFTINGATGEGKAGIYIHGSTIQDCTIHENGITGNKLGIHLKGAKSNKIKENIISGNTDSGIKLSGSDNNMLTSNTANNNSGDGIDMYSSRNNTLTDNTVTGNFAKYDVYPHYGIKLDGASNNNTIYNNYFNNTHNAYDDGNNIWNITKTPGENIVGWPYLGGNYWSDYAGADIDVDGLGDTSLPYNCSEQIAHGGDYRPLTVSLALRASTHYHLPHTYVLLYTELENVTGYEQCSCSNIAAYVVVNDKIIYALPMKNDGAGLGSRDHPDFIADDCHFSLWLLPESIEKAEKYVLDLYVTEKPFFEKESATQS